MNNGTYLWRKSSYTGTDNNCVELHVGPGQTGIRDTKDRAGGMITVAAAGWSQFLSMVKQTAN